MREGSAAAWLPNMCLPALLIVCLSQAELGRVWAREQTDALYGLLPWRGERPLEVRRTRRDQRQLGEGLAIDTLPDNKTHIVEDSRSYYSWRSFGPAEWDAEQLWVDMEALQHGQVRMHGILSNTHRQAAQVPLSFDFPFYGHYLRQVTIATGGFIFTGEVTHRMLTATQYIAPLMANFDPSFSRSSTVQYMDNGEVFVVQWDRVRLQGREAEGEFTFQAALHRSGTIVFSYRDVPLPVEMISSTQHPVKVGLSDAFMVLGPSPQNPDIQRKTIYEYHRAELDAAKIANRSAFEFTPLPTCLQHGSCEACHSSADTAGCSWCHTLQRCSDGIDRHRQEWLDFGCSEEAKELACEDLAAEEPDSAPPPPSGSDPTRPPGALPGGPVTEDDTKLVVLRKGPDSKTVPPVHQGAPVHSGVIAGVVTAAVLLLALLLVALYMSTHSYLIQQRTSYWPSMKYRKQGSRYAEVEGVAQRKGGLIEDEQY
ncbi:plexin domain-containing protein 1-like [Anguilla anguilla]|uniref:plexin domain-containing protein 1-like n=1 Tax=Anguilla anguilla TaxID=7936 RepID=UPI0015A7F02B|nr:plexin domain-containing protein 1-like [Anguilla anguilla]